MENREEKRNEGKRAKLPEELILKAVGGSGEKVSLEYPICYRCNVEMEPEPTESDSNHSKWKCPLCGEIAYTRG